MEELNNKIKQLEKAGIYTNNKTEEIEYITALSANELISVDASTLATYEILLAQHVIYLQQEYNKAAAKTLQKRKNFFELMMKYKDNTKHRSNEEKYMYYATLSGELFRAYSEWLDAEIEEKLQEKIADRHVEKLNAMKKLQFEIGKEYRGKATYYESNG